MDVDVIWLINKVPMELAIIISSYDPTIIFYYENKLEINWLQLMKLNFNLEYPKIITKDEIIC